MVLLASLDDSLRLLMLRWILVLQNTGGLYRKRLDGDVKGSKLLFTRFDLVLFDSLLYLFLLLG